MQKYERFIFESVNLNAAAHTIELNYSFDNQKHFTETISLPGDLPLRTNHPDLGAALEALHLAGGVSYYKAACPPEIELKKTHLTTAQANFWNTLYTHGLGEFFYHNQIDFRGLINFPATSSKTPHHSKNAAPLAPSRLLTPFGGGKDSLVTAELLRERGANQTLFRLRGHRLITELSELTDLPLIELDRTLAPEIFELNKAGAYNGHVPITAYISFLSIVVSLLAGYDGVVFSNERSSSYGNVDYLGMAVNHQWSKSLEAERLIRRYIADFVTPSVHYLNIIRPLSELHIAKLFARYPKYFSLATSCNRNWLLTDHDQHANHWCGHCPKCAFSFALLAAWLPATTVEKIFGHNLLNDESLLPLYRQLWGSEGFKPFECVGTPEETAAALYLASTKPGFADTTVMADFKATILPAMKRPDQLIHQLLTPEPGLSDPYSTKLLNQAPLP